MQGFSRAVMDEKSLSPLFPVGGGGGGGGSGYKWLVHNAAWKKASWYIPGLQELPSYNEVHTYEDW